MNFAKDVIGVKKEITEAHVTDRWLLVETFGARDVIRRLSPSPRLPSACFRWSRSSAGGYIHPIRAMIEQVAA